jgi:hypothetical protein
LEGRPAGQRANVAASSQKKPNREGLVAGAADADGHTAHPCSPTLSAFPSDMPPTLARISRDR